MKTSQITDNSVAPRSAASVKLLAAVAATIMLVAACGTTKKVATTAVEEFRMPVPTQAQADSILCALDADAEPGRFLTFVLSDASATASTASTSTPGTSTPSTASPAGDPVIYGIIPHRDSAQVKIVTITPDQRNWAVKESWSRSTATDEGLKFSRFADSAKVVILNNIPNLTFTEERTDGKRLQRTVTVFTPSTLESNGVSFSGRAVKDGKFKGTSDQNVRNGAERAQMIWAVQKMESYPDLIFQTEGDLMSDQAIEWWLSKNPAALTGAKRISIGQIPAESTLATAFEAAKKVKGAKYYAATFDTDDYTVIVSKNRSTGQYSLAWVEPVCKNKKTDRYITTIYFNQDTSNLVMHYYKGNRTFSYWLNLANGILQK